MTRKMKDSGIEWIGEIPEDWEIVQMRYLANITTGNKDTVDAEIDGKYPFFIRSKNIRRINSYSYDGEGILTAGDGDIGEIFHYINGKVDFHQRVYLFYKFKKISGKLLYFNLKSNLKKHISFFNAKTTVDSLRLPWLKEFPIPLPPQSQQKEIADFLDKKVSEIDNIISKTKKAIEEYKKYKQSLITETVTKGLDKNVGMKDSGIEWIGEIPEHWDVIRLGFLGRLQNGINKAGEEFGFGYPFINYGDIYRNYQLDKSEFSGLVNSTEKERENYSVKKGDVLFTRTSEIKEEIGYAATCLESIEGAVFTGFAIRFRPFKKSRLYPGFSKYYFRSEIHRKYFVKEMNIVTRVSLGQELLMKLSVLLPPLQEQKAISSYLDKKTNQIDQIISSKEKLLTEMEAYKKSLIYETVTGKREVE